MGGEGEVNQNVSRMKLLSRDVCVRTRSWSRGSRMTALDTASFVAQCRVEMSTLSFIPCLQLVWLSLEAHRRSAPCHVCFQHCVRSEIRNIVVFPGCAVDIAG